MPQRSSPKGLKETSGKHGFSGMRGLGLESFGIRVSGLEVSGFGLRDFRFAERTTASGVGKLESPKQAFLT